MSGDNTSKDSHDCEILQLIKKGSLYKLRNTYNTNKYHKLGAKSVENAIMSGNIEMLKYVFKHFNKYYMTMPLIDSCIEHNNLEGCKWIYKNKKGLLKKYPNILIDSMPFLKCAIGKDKPEIATFLIKHYHPRPNLQMPILMLAIYNHINTFRIWWPYLCLSKQVTVESILYLASQEESIDILNYLWNRQRSTVDLNYVLKIANEYNTQKTIDWINCVK